MNNPDHPIFVRPPRKKGESEKEPTYKSVKLYNFFAAHTSKEDFSGLDELLKDADIYIPEGFGWNEDWHEFYQRVANGNLSPEKFKELYLPESTIKELTSLYNTKIKILFVDLPETEAINEIDLDNSQNIFGDALRLFGSGDFNAAIDLVKKSETILADLQKRREAFMVSKLRVKLEELAKKQDKKSAAPLKVVMNLGSAHSGISKSIADLVPTARFFSDPLIIFSSGDEITRRLMLGKKISKDLWAHNLIETLIQTYVLLPIVPEAHRNTRLARLLASKLSIQDIAEICQAKLGEAKSDEEVRQRLTTELTKRGIKVPTTKEEAEQMLGRP